MPIEITMPQLSDTMTEGTVVKWNKKEGDKVRAGEEIADVETDKATMPMEAFEGGTLAAILVKEGEKLSVGGVLAVLATGSEKPEDVKKNYASGAGSAPKAARTRRSVTRSARICDSTMVARAASKSIIASASPPQDPNHGARGSAKPY